tara:strand:- start:4335 stop:5495 length:1161 start_codon:yes stop_codon:yes gene_type:complete
MKNVFNKWIELITEQAQGTNLVELVKNKIRESNANIRNEWDKTFKIYDYIQDDIANAMIKRFEIKNAKDVNRLNIFTLEHNPTTGQFKSDPKFPNKVLLKYEDDTFKSYELENISKKIYDKYIEDAGNKKVAFMINKRKEDKAKTKIHSRHIFNSTQRKVLKDQFHLNFFWNFQVTKVKNNDNTAIPLRLDTKIYSGFPFNRITPKDANGNLAPALQNVFSEIKQYLDKNPGVKLSISVESSASNLPATNKLVDGFTSPDHSYGKMMPANKWTTDDTKKTIVENGNAFLAKGRARSTITELAKFLDSKEVKQNGKSTISYGESDLVITMTSGVNGIKYIGPGKTPSSKFKPFQYVKIKATGFMIKPEPKPKNQITSWRLQIGAQMK